MDEGKGEDMLGIKNRLKTRGKWARKGGDLIKQ